jgi:SAM-dependent methyltransferase
MGSVVKRPMPQSSALIDRLRRLGACSWYTRSAAGAYFTDPWLAFSLASGQVQSTIGPLRIALDLLVRNQPTTRPDIVRALGRPATEWLESNGLLRLRAGNRYTSELCLVVAFGEFLLTDWPTETPAHRLTSRRTYLSTTSYDCVRFVDQSAPVHRALDLGCGTGLVALKLAQRAEEVVAVDIDERACWLTELNCSVRTATFSTIQVDWKSLPYSHDFDFIITNPAWRIVPPGVRYPNPMARVGIGVGGLGQVIELLKLLPHLLSRGGTAAIRFDLPVNRNGRCPFDFDPAAITNDRTKHRFEILGTTSIEDQANISADTCVDLNPDAKNLSMVFRDHYSSLTIHSLRHVFCVVEKL